MDANGRALLQAWRSAGRPIIHVRHDSGEHWQQRGSELGLQVFELGAGSLLLAGVDVLAVGLAVALAVANCV